MKTEMAEKACIFGAGKMGVEAVRLLQGYRERFFCDNDKRKVGTSVNGVIVKGFDELTLICKEGSVDVYIAGYVQEIYEQCIRNGVRIAGIYNPKNNEMTSYQEYCISNQCWYCNGAFVKYKDEKRQKIQTNITKFSEGRALSECIIEVAIELSNLCNYACLHKKCPASQINEKKVMPLDDIDKIIDALYDIDFTGTIHFQIYNEPLMDPRLFYIINRIKDKLKDVKILVYTNGYYLTESVANDLQDGFADIIVATGYNQSEFSRLINLKIDVPFSVLWGALDDRLIWAEGNKEACDVPCASLFSLTPIWVNCDVGLCCMDCHQRVTFGNIKEQSLREILNSAELREIMNKLISGNRKAVRSCLSCDWKGISI